MSSAIVNLYYEDRISSKIINSYQDLLTFFKSFVQTKISEFKKKKIEYYEFDFIMICDILNPSSQRTKLTQAIFTSKDYLIALQENIVDYNPLPCLNIQVIDKEFYIDQLWDNYLNNYKGEYHSLNTQTIDIIKALNKMDSNIKMNNSQIIGYKSHYINSCRLKTENLSMTQNHIVNDNLYHKTMEYNIENIRTKSEKKIKLGAMILPPKAKCQLLLPIRNIGKKTIHEETRVLFYKGPLINNSSSKLIKKVHPRNKGYFDIQFITPEYCAQYKSLALLVSPKNKLIKGEHIVIDFTVVSAQDFKFMFYGYKINNESLVINKYYDFFVEYSQKINSFIQTQNKKKITTSKSQESSNQFSQTPQFILNMSEKTSQNMNNNNSQNNLALQDIDEEKKQDIRITKVNSQSNEYLLSNNPLLKEKLPSNNNNNQVINPFKNGWDKFVPPSKDIYFAKPLENSINSKFNPQQLLAASTEFSLSKSLKSQATRQLPSFQQSTILNNTSSHQQTTFINILFGDKAQQASAEMTSKQILSSSIKNFPAQNEFSANKILHGHRDDSKDKFNFTISESQNSSQFQ